MRDSAVLGLDPWVISHRLEDAFDGVLAHRRPDQVSEELSVAVPRAISEQLEDEVSGLTCHLFGHHGRCLHLRVPGTARRPIRRWAQSSENKAEEDIGTSIQE